ncbi:hypothetical protein GMORB2_5069 [Geosmithia morbida]|uniref:Uncharacterized protein n=1 Tax=Geosmithia morbida TaxID=1094350 RepID=A0A9P4YWI8_9HYPO|nr:uncharacterized protein GMORB2_5069 [Geosmithia morbida]KAF4124403.1 hypothetical protein GMORB2_5069 [Geosmithia morbida]
MPAAAPACPTAVVAHRLMSAAAVVIGHQPQASSRNLVLDRVSPFPASRAHHNGLHRCIL